MTFQPGRLVFARKRRQLSQTALANLVGLSSKQIQRYEKDEDEPRAETLERIAGALNFSVEFFAGARPMPEIHEPGLSFRCAARIPAKLRDNALAVSQLAVQIEGVLADRFELPEVDVPDLREVASSPEEAARVLRAAWGLGDMPVWNMVELLERRGCRVFSLSDDTTKVDAFCFWFDGTPFVILSLKKSGERGRWDGAHELGHLIWHRSIDYTGKDVEREADAFAAEFLVPADVLRRQSTDMITSSVVVKLKRYWKVSAMAMIKRLKDVGRLTEWTYRHLCMKFARDGYREREPDGIERERSDLLTRMLTSGGMTASELARELSLRLQEISPLIFGLPFARGTLKLLQAAEAG